MTTATDIHPPAAPIAAAPRKRKTPIKRGTGSKKLPARGLEAAAIKAKVAEAKPKEYPPCISASVLDDHYAAVATPRISKSKKADTLLSQLGNRSVVERSPFMIELMRASLAATYGTAGKYAGASDMVIAQLFNNSTGVAHMSKACFLYTDQVCYAIESVNDNDYPGGKSKKDEDIAAVRDVAAAHYAMVHGLLKRTREMMKTHTQFIHTHNRGIR